MVKMQLFTAKKHPVKTMLLYLQKHHKNHDIVGHDNKEIDTLFLRLGSLANGLVSLKTKILATKEEMEENEVGNTLQC